MVRKVLRDLFYKWKRRTFASTLVALIVAFILTVFLDFPELTGMFWIIIIGAISVALIIWPLSLLVLIIGQSQKYQEYTSNLGIVFVAFGFLLQLGYYYVLTSGLIIGWCYILE